MIIWAAFKGMVVVAKKSHQQLRTKISFVTMFHWKAYSYWKIVVLNSEKDEKAAQSRSQQSHCIQGKLALQDDNINLREEVEGLHRKFEALKRFAAQKKIRLPAEFEQYQ